MLKPYFLFVLPCGTLPHSSDSDTDFRSPVAPKNKQGIQLAWTTVTYRSVAIIVVLIALILGAATYIIFPQPTKNVASWVSDKLVDVVSKIGGKPVAKTGKAGEQQATFTQIDGNVRVKKANSNTWVNADYTTPLEKGDVVQTSSDGIAKVVFADGTNYTVKQDSLIVVEENSTNAAQQTNVAVQVTSGTVDLATATYAQGSSSKVLVAGATAQMAPDTAAMVHNDPRLDQHDVLVKRGSAQVIRGTETVQLGNYERVSFTSDSATMTKAKEMAPPTLIAPANMYSMFSAGAQQVDFSWTPISNASSYRVRISRNPFFSSTVFDKKVAVPELHVPGLTEGAYYWTVMSVDSTGKESIESEKNRFTIIAHSVQGELMLELQPFVQHGHVIEVRGKTEPNARVMVNGQETPLVRDDGSFQFFTPPLPNGENLITVTAQNAKGRVNTKTQTVVIQ